MQNKIEVKLENSNLSEHSLSDNGGIVWTDEAEKYIEDAPKFVRLKIRKNAGEKALNLGIKEITLTFIENLRK